MRWFTAAGLLTGSEARFQAVHVTALQALLQTRPPTCPALFLSAVGIDEVDTPFARYRRDSERVCQQEGAITLRAGLVLGDTSYGGSSLARALSALPLITPQIGGGQQAFNPIHAADLSNSIDDLLSRNQPGHYEIGGPETVTQKDMLTAYRRWLGLGGSLALPLPRWLARGIGWVGDRMQLGPISSTAVDQLDAGVLATVDHTGTTARPLAGFTQFLHARPAGTQDLWHARLYLLRPLLRVTLAFLWLFSAALGLFLAPETFLPMLPNAPWPDGISVLMARLGRRGGSGFGVGPAARLAAQTDRRRAIRHGRHLHAGLYPSRPRPLAFALGRGAQEPANPDAHRDLRRVRGRTLMDWYLIAKWLHILSSTVLFGTGMGTAFQMVWAMHLHARTGRVETVHSVASGVVMADWLFTTPAGVFQPLSGLWLIHLAGYSLLEPWLIATYALYILAFCAWAPVVHLQLRIRDLAGDAAAQQKPLPEQALRYYRIWFALGWPAFIALTGVFWLMIAKPDLGF